MSDQEKIVRLVQHGTELVDSTTKYLSTLPHPIECLEELISVVAVTCSLLESVSSNLPRFLTSNVGPSVSFLGPLCEDVGKGFCELEKKIEESKNLKVFEPNDVGLVRIPRNAWILVMSGDSNAQALRQRLFVGKYRVRVLNEAIAWFGLYHTAVNRGLKGAEVEEFRALNASLADAVALFVQFEKEELKALKTPEAPLKRGKFSIFSCASTKSEASTSFSSSRFTFPPKKKSA